MSTDTKRAKSSGLRELRRTVPTCRAGIRATYTAVVAAILVVVMSTSASARWSTLGTGSGFASTGTLAAPTGTTASSTAGSGTVNVSWTAPVGGVAPSGYTVSRVPTAGPPVSVCGTSSTLVTGTSCSDTSVPDGTYTYVVTSIRGSWTAAGTASAPVTVTNTVSTTTAVTSSGTPSVVGQTVTYTATVTQASGTMPPTGTVTFKDGASTITCTGGNQTLSAGTATCSLSSAGVGTHSITAVYPGAGVFTGSTSSPITQTVNAASTTTALTSSVNPSVTGQTVTFTATVAAVSPGSGTPTGTVSFTNGGNSITCTGGTQTLNAGVATCQVAFGTVGTKTVAATYTGSANYVSSTSTNLSQVVNKALTSTALVTSKSPQKSGTAVTYTATVTATSPGAGTPTGSVTFVDASSGTITCAGGTQTLNASGVATCQVTYASAGQHSISAVYGGDGNYSTSTSATLTQRVVSSSVAGISFSGVTVNGSAATFTCSGTLGASDYTCTTTSGTGNNKIVVGTPVFVAANGTTPTVYATDTSTTLSWVSTGKTPSSGTVSVAANASAGGSTVTAQMNGSNAAQVTVTMSDGLNSFSVILKVQ